MSVANAHWFYFLIFSIDDFSLNLLLICFCFCERFRWRKLNRNEALESETHWTSRVVRLYLEANIFICRILSGARVLQWIFCVLCCVAKIQVSVTFRNFFLVIESQPEHVLKIVLKFQNIISTTGPDEDLILTLVLLFSSLLY